MSGRSYAEALAALQGRGRFGIRLGLGRTRAILRALGEPQLSFRGALIAGTNGKGSVLALAESALRAAGYRVGATPKPHLVTYRERLQIDAAPVDPDTFGRLVATVLPVADRVGRRLGDPTEFEILTAAIFLWFAEQKVDLAVVEVGLGGRLDATHTWDGGVAVITNVDLDHMDRLGPTIPLIAREKAAIIERGDIAVTGATGEALDVVRARARRVGAPLAAVTAAPLIALTRDAIRVDLPRLGPTDVGLRGRHQAQNVAVADALLDGLEAAGTARVGDEARRAGYRDARWPGRLELISAPDGNEVLLDGAHNPAGAATLAQAIDDLRPFLRGATPRDATRLTVVTAMMADKDVAGTVAAMSSATALAGAHVIVTQVAGSRAMPAAELAAVWVRGDPRLRVTVQPDVERAMDEALRDARGPIVVAGSLYLVGQVRARLVDDPALRDPVLEPVA
jgi:dihydrofolate synthase/folylpolyglutamate synthase